MNRQQEYWALIRELDQTPPALDGTAARAKARAKRRRIGKRWGFSLGSLAGVCAAFVVAVNTIPTFALACSNVPILRELAAAVAFSPSLSAAVEHDYVQYLGQSQTANGITLTLESVIADQQQMVFFYRTDGDAPYYSISCDLMDPEGNPLQGYAITSSSDAQDLKQFAIHFMDTAVPEAFTLELRLCETDEDGQNQWMTLTYSFQIQLDPDKTAPTVTLPVGQWLEVDGQRLLIDRLELTPTRTVLYLDDDPANTAWLQSLSFHFLDEDGTVYENVDGSLTASGRSDGDGFYTYYFQSFYFLDDPQSLTLCLDQAVWLDKDAESIQVDLTDDSYTGTLPEQVLDLSVTEQSIAELGPQRVILVDSRINRAPFDQIYRDLEGKEYSFDGYGMSQEWTDEDGTHHPYRFTYTLEDYHGDTVQLPLSYTKVTTWDDPFPIALG